MQRVRIGLTGLAFVFLAVLLAAVFTRNPTRETPITPNLIEQQKSGAPVPAAAGQTAAPPADPLAQLGVAPGNADSNRTAAPAPPAAPPAR
jgi:hypothetical protein